MAVLAQSNAYWRTDWSNQLCSSYATLSSSKQLLNDVIFVWFTDKNLFALATMKNSDKNQLYSSMAMKKKRHNAIFPEEWHLSFACGLCGDCWCQNTPVSYCLIRESKSTKSVIGACFCHSSCCLIYVSSLASTETVPHCTDHAFFSDINISQGSAFKCGGIFISAKWTKWMAEIMCLFDVCLCLSVCAQRPVMGVKC